MKSTRTLPWDPELWQVHFKQQSFPFETWLKLQTFDPTCPTRVLTVLSEWQAKHTAIDWAKLRAWWQNQTWVIRPDIDWVATFRRAPDGVCCEHLFKLWQPTITSWEANGHQAAQILSTAKSRAQRSAWQNEMLRNKKQSLHWGIVVTWDRFTQGDTNALSNYIVKTVGSLSASSEYKTGVRWYALAWWSAMDSNRVAVPFIRNLHDHFYYKDAHNGGVAPGDWVAVRDYLALPLLEKSKTCGRWLSQLEIVTSGIAVPPAWHTLPSADVEFAIRMHRNAERLAWATPEWKDWVLAMISQHRTSWSITSRARLLPAVAAMVQRDAYYGNNLSVSQWRDLGSEADDNETTIPYKVMFPEHADQINAIINAAQLLQADRGVKPRHFGGYESTSDLAYLLEEFIHNLRHQKTYAPLPDLLAADMA